MIAPGTPSPLSLRALARMQGQVAAGVRGGVKPWARFRGPDIDPPQRAVGLPIAPSPTVTGFPWCAAIVYDNHRMSATGAEPSYCPRTASALHMATNAPPWCRLPGPRPGAVGVLRHRDMVHGHVVTCEDAFEDGTVTTVEGDTNVAGSSTGDQAGRHERWNPDDGSRGELLGWWDFGLPEPGHA